ncbi:MAG: helix-turn-helix transcriptional regulator [Ketobacter sp.]|nr:helix-turn-helix transcriptional regulator [Ketobacter sp.]
MPNIALCARLKEERQRLGYTQSDFAALVGASKRTQIGWEQGRSFPDASALEKWAAHEVDVHYVVTGFRAGLDDQRPKIPKEVGEFLIRECGISAAWLATGEGSMFQTDSEKKLLSRLDAIKEASFLADLNGLEGIEKARAQELVLGLLIKDVGLVRSALSELSSEEREVIAWYRSTDEKGKKAIDATAKALAQNGNNNDN